MQEVQSPIHSSTMHQDCKYSSLILPFGEECLDSKFRSFLGASKIPKFQVGQKFTGEPCLAERLGRGVKPCRGGKLRDSILDWEDELPVEGLQASLEHCRNADLVMCLGSTLQILPVGTMPLQVSLTNIIDFFLGNRQQLPINDR